MCERDVFRCEARALQCLQVHFISQVFKGTVCIIDVHLRNTCTSRVVFLRWIVPIKYHLSQCLWLEQKCEHFPLSLVMSAEGSFPPTFLLPHLGSHFLSIFLVLVNTFEASGRYDHGCVCKVASVCLTICNPMDCSPPGSSIHGILQARILEWVAMSFSRRSSWPRDQTCVSYISFIGRLILYHFHHLGWLSL